MTLRPTLFAVVLATCIAGAAHAALAAAAPAAGPAFKVTSTLDGKSVLPHRIHWIARTTLAQSNVGEVAFLIDGKVRWIEREAPYTYGDDGAHLVTSFLSPGRHRFTVRVKSADGRTGTSTVTARVVPAPEPPAELAGTWQRDVQGARETIGGPPGIYTILFERRWIQDRAPGAWNPDTGAGAVIDNDWVLRGNTFEVVGSVTFRILRDEDAEGGWWCKPKGQKAIYSWAVSGDTLTLAPVSGADPCGERGAVYTGTWTRVR